jgi:hypothetical protein
MLHLLPFSPDHLAVTASPALILWVWMLHQPRGQVNCIVKTKSKEIKNHQKQ